MDKKQQSKLVTEEEKAAEVKANLKSTSRLPALSDENEDKQKRDLLQELIDERKTHRKEMLKHVLILTYASFVLLALIIIVQGFVRLFRFDKSFAILDNYQLNIFAVSVFGQVIGVIIIIVKSLWDDEDYLKKI